MGKKADGEIPKSTKAIYVDAVRCFWNAQGRCSLGWRHAVILVWRHGASRHWSPSLSTSESGICYTHYAGGRWCKLRLRRGG